MTLLKKFKVSDKGISQCKEDVICPWCAVGYRKLTQAIKELDIEAKVENRQIDLPI